LITASDSTIRIWDLDRAAPPADASWPDLRTYLASATSGCLSAQDRTTILGESNATANSAYDKCAERLGLRPVVVASSAQLESPNAPKTRPTGAPSNPTKTPVVPASPTDTIDVKPLMDGRLKTWTGDWTRAEGATSSIELSLTFRGEKASGHVRWTAAS